MLLLTIGTSIFIPTPAHAKVDQLPAPTTETPLKIKALNPGYSIADIANVGEFIELVKISDDSSISLTGFTLRYTNSSGKSSNLFEFPEGSQMTGDTILLRYSGSPESSLADALYTKTLAMEAGPLELVYRDIVVDTVCWKGKDCLPSFSSATPTSIVQDLSEGMYSHQTNYTPAFDKNSKNYSPPIEDASSDTSDTISVPQCRGLIFNEILSYYETDKTEQFIEFYNPTDEPIKLDGCQIRYKKKLYPLSGMVDASSYYLRYPTDFTLTKNPNTSNLLELIDTTTEVVDSLEYPHGQKKSASYALVGYGQDSSPQWSITYRPTPGAENVPQEFRSCPDGKIINEVTGNCVKASTLKTALAECPEGKYRNPLTGRCKKIETDATSECKEGYERNPETGRCRKIKNNAGADYALVPETSGEKTVFIAALTIISLIIIALGYIGFQFRHEIARFIKHKFPKKT